MSELDYKFSSAAQDFFTSGARVGIVCNLYALVEQGWDDYKNDGSLNFDLARFLIRAQQAGHAVAVTVGQGDEPAELMRRFDKLILPKIVDEMGLGHHQLAAFREVLVGAREGGTLGRPHFYRDNEIAGLTRFSAGPQVMIDYHRNMVCNNSKGISTCLTALSADKVVSHLTENPGLIVPVKVQKPVFTFVSDVNGTLYDDDRVLREDYMAALINLHRAGHRVIISSANPEDAQEMLRADVSKIKSIFEDLGVSPEQRAEFASVVLLQIHNKDDDYPDGIGVPDIQCDDGPIVRALHRLGTESEEFSDFVEDARVSPVDADEALLEFVEHRRARPTMKDDLFYIHAEKSELDSLQPE